MESSEEVGNKTPPDPTSAANSNAADAKVENEITEDGSCGNTEGEKDKTELGDEEVGAKSSDQSALAPSPESDRSNDCEEGPTTSRIAEQTIDETAESTIDHVYEASSPKVSEALKETGNSLDKNIQEDHFGNKENGEDSLRIKWKGENAGRSNHGNPTKPIQANPSNQAEIVLNYLQKIVFPAVLEISKRYQINSVSDLEKRIAFHFVGDNNNEDTDNNQTCALPTNINIERATEAICQYPETNPVISEVERLTSEIGNLRESNETYKNEYQHLCNKYSTITEAITYFYKQVQKIKLSSTAAISLWKATIAESKPEDNNSPNRIINTIDYVQKLCGYTNQFQINQEAEIKRQAVEIKKHKDEAAKQKNQIGTLNRQLEELRKDMKVTEREYEKKLRAEESQKKNYMDQLKQESEKLIHQLDTNEKILKETNILINKIAVLEKSIEQLNESLKMQQNKECEIRNQLKIIKDTIQWQEDSLKTKTETFNKSLKEISDKVKAHKMKLSLDDIKRKTEKNIIDQAVKKINEIQGNIKKYENQISSFRGDSEDKTYLDIKDILIRAVEKLDSIESQKKTEIQRHRREAINYIKHWHDELEKKVHQY